MWRITYETLMKKEPDPRGFEDAESLWGCKSLVNEVENMCAIDISAVQNACDIYCFLGDCFSSSMGSGRVLSNVIGCDSDMHRPALAFHQNVGGSLSLFIPTVVSGLLVILGWFVVNRNQANRERRKQIREYVLGLMEELSELESQIFKYHTEVRDKSVEQIFILRLTRFEKSCARLPEFSGRQFFLKAVKKDDLEVSPAIIQKMRRAMTLRHFMDEHDGAVEHTESILEEMAIAMDEVRDGLETIRLSVLD